MRTVVHLSDMHFGRVNPVVADVLRETVKDLRPDIVVVSGDFTQRARRGSSGRPERFSICCRSRS
jgi:3',5'-cyclic AMP phosphodiesterase CpdA